MNQATQVVPTLDTPMQSGENVIWCASFLAAWKSLQNDVAGEPLKSTTEQVVVEHLNQAPDPTADIPEKSIYAKAGQAGTGIISTIQSEMKTRFPNHQTPTFPNIAHDSLVAYAYLQAGIKFNIPYFQSRKPLAFTDSAGSETRVNAFGIRKKDEYAYFQLREQVDILYQKGTSWDGDLEFVIDLCRHSEPDQIVIARIRPEDTLAATLSSLEMKAKGMEKDSDYFRRLGPNDVLLVPDMLWRLEHHFEALEGISFTNQALVNQRLDIALQEIQFKLDRSGAELSSEAKMYMLPVPTYFVADRPFLIMMKKRQARRPYFVVWVDNAALLQPFRLNQGITNTIKRILTGITRRNQKNNDA